VSGPRLVRGGIAVDDRGDVSFANDFDFADVQRFYMVANHRRGFVRAWHAHKNEGKYVLVVKGAALVCGVEIDDWTAPGKDLEIHRFVLGEKAPSLLYLPPGFANGFMSLTDDTKIIFFSTSKLEDSLDDDYRYDARYWDPWHVEER